MGLRVESGAEVQVRLSEDESQFASVAAGEGLLLVVVCTAGRLGEQSGEDQRNENSLLAERQRRFDTVQIDVSPRMTISGIEERPGHQ